MNGDDSNLAAWRLGGERDREGSLGPEEELTAEADTEEIAGGNYGTADEDGQETNGDDDPDVGGPLDDHHLDQFVELDQEVEHYAARMLNPVGSPPTTFKPLLQRIFANLRSRFFSDADDSQGPATSLEERLAASENKPPISAMASQTDLSIVMCRICDRPIDATTVYGHTEWCSKYQDGLLKKEKCAKYLHLLLESLPSEDLQLQSLVIKASEIDEETGRAASVRLAKLLYKIAKVSSLPAGDGRNREQMIRRLRYLVDQKRVLAERFLELKPALAATPLIFEASSGTDSSIDSTPSTRTRW